MASATPDAPTASFKLQFKFKSVDIFELDISDAEPIGEVRTLLNDHPFLKLHPHFRLCFRGQRLMEGAIISAQIPKPEPVLPIDLFLDCFTNQTAERHVSQCAEFFLNPLFYLNESFIDFNVFLGRPEFVANMVARQETPTAEATLDDIIRTNVPKLTHLTFLTTDAPGPRFFTSLSYSRYNPVPSHLRMQDDLFYLDVETKEGKYACLTANKRGFFVNESTPSTFNPKPASTVATSLFDVLSGLSPTFKSELDSIIQFDSQDAHDQLMNSPQIVRSPLEEQRTFGETETFNLWTSSLTQLRQTLSEIRHGTNLKVYRDWNEEFQSYRGLAVQDNMQQLQKTKILRKVYRDFSRSAQEICKAIVNNHFLAVNQTDKRVEECFVFNNFFITYAEDRLDWETPRLETTPSTYSNINSDLKNLQQIYSLDLPGVNVINTCAVDYLGLRLVVQTMITGILHFDQKTWNCYGSIDDGKTFNDNSEFAPIFEELCRNFKLKTGCVFKDPSGKEFKIHGSPEVKGIKAGDGRKYVMDLMKLSPRDLNFPRVKEDEGCLVRPELIRNFFFINSIEELYAKNGEAAKAKEDSEAQAVAQPVEQAKVEAGAEGEKTPKADTQEPVTPPSTPVHPIDQAKPETQLTEADTKAAAQTPAPAPKTQKMEYFNPNIGSMIENEDDGLKTQETEHLKALATFIIENAIPFFKNELGSNPTSVPIDMESLVELLHKYGINVRYLGKIYKQFDQPADRFFKLLFEKVILIRSLRKFFRRIALQMTCNELTQVITHVLNCVLGDSAVRAHIDQRVQQANPKANGQEDKNSDQKEKSANGKKNKKNKKKKVANNPSCITENNNEMLGMTSSEILKEVSEIALARYGADFSQLNGWEGFLCLSTPKDKIAFLREFARSMGLILASRTYSFCMPISGFEAPLRFRDFLGVSPRLKSPNFHIEGIKFTYKSIENEINEKNFDNALNMLLSCQSIILNTYGLFNSDFIYVTSKIASLHFLRGQVDKAVRMQTLVVKVSERVFGLDHFNTAFSIIELSNYVFESRKVDTSIGLHSLAVFIFDLVGGPLNPSSLLCLQEMHLLYAQTKRPEQSADAMEELLRRNEKIFGETDEHLLFLLGKLASLKGDLGKFKEASILQARKSLILKRILKNTGSESNDYARKIIDEKITDSEFVKNVFVQKQKESEAKAALANNAVVDGAAGKQKAGGKSGKK